MAEKMVPLLSDGLRKLIETIEEKHPTCEIAKELLRADDIVTEYNNLRDFNFKFKTTYDILEKALNELITDEARMFSFRFDFFELSYLPKGKDAIYSSAGVWSRENRQTAKPARIIQKLLVKTFKCIDFENFSNWLKNEMFVSGDFVLVEGSDITKYYNEDTYLEVKGTLGNSCMRYDMCSDYFGVYEDHAKMLICRKNDKILGRALVWELPEGTFMDRIYTCYDYLEPQFIDYAKLQGWYHRINNRLLSDGDMQEWFSPQDNYKKPVYPRLTIQLQVSYNHMPYVDSFRYYNEENNIISTSPDDGEYVLSNTDGSYDNRCEIYECECCHNTERGYSDEQPEDWCYSEYQGIWLCPHCAVYCEGTNDYVSRNTPVVEVKDEDEITRLYPLDFVKAHGYVNIEGNWYDPAHPDVRYNTETDVYYLV